MVVKEPKDRIIVALDVNDLGSAEEYAQELAPYVGLFKVGLELITAGLAQVLIGHIHASGGSVFYDGKFGDTPNTVAAAAREATRLGATMFNVHATCGYEAMVAAAKAAKETHEVNRLTGKRPIILGVTILTSLDYAGLVQIGLLTGREATEGPHGEDWRPDHIKRRVVALARLAQESGLDGVVTSPQEISAIREACGPDFLIVTPGVRPVRAAVEDHKRVTTPREAIKAGADYLVIGRPILKPPSGTRVEAAQRIAEEIYLAQLQMSIPPGQASPL